MKNLMKTKRIAVAAAAAMAFASMAGAASHAVGAKCTGDLCKAASAGDVKGHVAKKHSCQCKDHKTCQCGAADTAKKSCAHKRAADK